VGESRIRRWGLIATLVLALLIRLFVACQSVPFLLKLNLPDDAFYYFVIAGHILNGDGSSFDGLTLNNGYHPLWMLMILPLFAVKSANADIPVHLALSMGALVDVLTCYLLYRIAHHISGGPLAGLIAALFYSVNVMNVLQATNGLETALGGALAAACWWRALSLAERPTVRGGVGWGILVGLMVLARTDYVILAVCLGLYLLARQRSWAALGVTITAAAVSVAVASPWLVWSQARFGSVMQVSGVAVPYAAHERHLMANGPGLAEWLKAALGHLSRPEGWLRGDFTGTAPFTGPFWWALVIVALVRSWVKGNRTWVYAWLPMTAAAAGLVLTHTLIRWYPRPWYFVASAQALAVGLGIGMTTIFSRGNLLPWSRRLLAVLLGALMVASLASWIFIWRIGLYPWQDRMLEAAEWIAQKVPHGEIVASLNAGIYAYYGDHTVVNLDGVVNPDAFAAIRERRLFAYMQEVGVSYFLDFDHALDSEYGVFMGPGYPEKLVYIGQVASTPYPILGTIRAYRVISP